MESRNREKAAGHFWGWGSDLAEDKPLDSAMSSGGATRADPIKPHRGKGDAAVRQTDASIAKIAKSTSMENR
jgi:hypothetical protein